MFDWARGSALKRFVDLGIYPACCDPTNARWLKDWHTPWLLGLVEFRPEMSVLDVGSARPSFMNDLHRQHGCEVHALDAARATATEVQFGFPSDVEQAFPHATMHVGLAGDETLPAERFDVITCISTLEHTYDRISPLNVENPMPHLNALRDMVRMLKPGGVFLMNWDIYLHGLYHHTGWDFEIDYRILRACGMRLCVDRRILRGAQYLYDHPDSLFFDHEDILACNVGDPVRGTAINILWRKPGDASRVPVRPRPELEAVYFPPDETRHASGDAIAPDVTTDEIDKRFQTIIARVTDVLSRTDATGQCTDRHGRIVQNRRTFPFNLFRQG